MPLPLSAGCRRRSRPREFARHAKGDIDGAITDYDQAIRLDPKDAVAYQSRAAVRQRLPLRPGGRALARAGVITVLFLFAYGFQLVFAGREEDFAVTSASYYPGLKRAGELASLYVIALLLVNVLAVAVQCGTGACHTMGYALL